MRDVVLYTLLSLDGVAEEPGDWMFEADDAVFSNLAAVIARQDDVLLGRGTYDYWAGYWPTSDVQPFADFVNATTKHVVTSSELSLPWANTQVVNGDPLPYVEDLRAAAGGDIGVHGSITLAQSLLSADLVDRLELVIVPTIAGSGRRLFQQPNTLRRLALTKATSSPTGCLFISYERH